MYGLKIHISSFVLNSNLVQGNDKVRLSITTIPQESKEIYSMEAKKLFESHHFFSINISNQTRKIVFILRKISFIQNDPIISSTTINACDFPSPNNSKNADVQTVKLYEPIQKMKNKLQDRRVLGQMEIRFTITEPEYSFDGKVNIDKLHNGQGYSKVKVYSHTLNENQNQNNSIFDDF